MEDEVPMLFCGNTEINKEIYTSGGVSVWTASTVSANGGF